MSILRIIRIRINMLMPVKLNSFTRLRAHDRYTYRFGGELINLAQWIHWVADELFGHLCHLRAESRVWAQHQRSSCRPSATKQKLVR
jgi:hypothetical protein